VQYNIALGFKRAHATASYLQTLGIPASRMTEISYGKELPLCTDSTDSCWAMNRRADVTPGSHPKNVAAKVRADQRRERNARANSRTGAPAAASATHDSRSVPVQPSATEATPTR
jgi:hypothetical protein